MEINIKQDSNNHDATWSRQHFEKLMHNYGHAIEPFAQTLVGQTQMAKDVLDKVRVRVDTASNIKNSERYWALIASLSLAGGSIAKQLGLHDIPIAPVFDYGIKLIKESRSRSTDTMFDDEEFLGSFLQRHFHEILVINGTKDNRTGLEHAPIQKPRGALTARYEPDTKMLYVAVRAFREDCSKIMANFEEIIEPYRKNGALMAIKKKRMTAGTEANTQAPVSALCFDTTKLAFFDGTVLTEPNENSGATDTD